MTAGTLKAKTETLFRLGVVIAVMGVVAFHLLYPTTYSACAKALHLPGRQALPQLPLDQCVSPAVLDRIVAAWRWI